MRNTGIEYTSAERTPTILPDLAELLPPLSGEQSAALEKDPVSYTHLTLPTNSRV